MQGIRNTIVQVKKTDPAGNQAFNSMGSFTGLKIGESMASIRN
jgi:hypothetical protein